MKSLLHPIFIVFPSHPLVVGFTCLRKSWNTESILALVNQTMTKSTACTFALAAPLAFCLSYPSSAQENALEAKHFADIDIWLNGGQFTDDLTSAYIENYLNESSVVMAGCTNSLYYGLSYSIG